MHHTAASRIASATIWALLVQSPLVAAGCHHEFVYGGAAVPALKVDGFDQKRVAVVFSESAIRQRYDFWFGGHSYTLENLRILLEQAYWSSLRHAVASTRPMNQARPDYDLYLYPELVSIAGRYNFPMYKCEVVLAVTARNSAGKTIATARAQYTSSFFLMDALGEACAVASQATVKETTTALLADVQKAAGAES